MKAVAAQETGRASGHPGGRAARVHVRTCADSRHGHVAAVDDDVPQLRGARLVGQL